MKSLDYISDIFTSSKSERNLPNVRRIPKNSTPQVIICLESGNVLINNTHTSPVQRTVTPVTPTSSDASSDGRSPSPVQEKMHPTLREPLNSVSGNNEEPKAPSSHGCLSIVESKVKHYVELPGSFSFDTPDAAMPSVETSKLTKSGLGLKGCGSTLKELESGGWQEWRAPSRNGSITTTVSDGDESREAKFSSEDSKLSNEETTSLTYTDSNGRLSPVPRKVARLAPSSHGQSTNADANNQDTEKQHSPPATLGDSTMTIKAVDGRKSPDDQVSPSQPPQSPVSTSGKEEGRSSRRSCLSCCCHHCSFYTSELAALQFRVVELEYMNATLEAKVRQYRQEIRLFKKDVKGYKKDEKHFSKLLEEKDTEIIALHEKIAQLVAASSPTSTQVAGKEIKKSLPSPYSSPTDEFPSDVRLSSRTVQYEGKSAAEKERKIKTWI